LQRNAESNAQLPKKSDSQVLENNMPHKKIQHMTGNYYAGVVKGSPVEFDTHRQVHGPAIDWHDKGTEYGLKKEERLVGLRK
jgi:hypothetical protein